MPIAVLVEAIHIARGARIDWVLEIAILHLPWLHLSRLHLRWLPTHVLLLLAHCSHLAHVLPLQGLPLHGHLWMLLLLLLVSLLVV